MNEERLEQLESKIAFLEQANAQLSDEVLHQQGLLLRLQARLRDLESLLAADKPAEPNAADERPPHY